VLSAVSFLSSHLADTCLATTLTRAFVPRSAGTTRHDASAMVAELQRSAASVSQIGLGQTRGDPIVERRSAGRSEHSATNAHRIITLNFCPCLVTTHEMGHVAIHVRS
jgi:hypothetical protein